MPRNGAYTLGEVRAERVIVECDQCQRRGEYATQRLLERFGTDIAMPALKAELVKCQHQDLSMVTPCKALFSKETRESRE